MQQFVVPQFIDVEDKIIGPISVRQFVIILVAGLLIVAEYKLSDFSLFLVLGLTTLALAIVLAFIKVNGQPFHYFLLNIIQTLRRPRLKIWNKQVQLTKKKKRKKEEKSDETTVVPKKQSLISSHLSELSLIVDTGGVYKGEDQ